MHLASRGLVSRYATETKETNNLNENNLIKNPNLKEADQLAIYKAGRPWIRGHRREIHPVAERKNDHRDSRALRTHKTLIYVLIF